MVAGASGLIGSALVDSLRGDGVRVSTLVRRAAQTPDEIEWLTGAGPLDPQQLEGADAEMNAGAAVPSALTAVASSWVGVRRDQMRVCW